MDFNHLVAFNKIIEITMLLILKCYQCHECHLFIDASPDLEIIYNIQYAKQEFGNHFKKLFSKIKAYERKEHGLGNV